MDSIIRINTEHTTHRRATNLLTSVLPYKYGKTPHAGKENVWHWIIKVHRVVRRAVHTYHSMASQVIDFWQKSNCYPLPNSKQVAPSRAVPIISHRLVFVKRFLWFFRDFLDTSETHSSRRPLALYSHIVNRSLMLSSTIRSGHNRQLSLFAVHPVWRPSLNCALSILDIDTVVNPFFAFFYFLLSGCYWDLFLLLIRLDPANGH